MSLTRIGKSNQANFVHTGSEASSTLRPRLTASCTSHAWPVGQPTHVWMVLPGAPALPYSLRHNYKPYAERTGLVPEFATTSHAEHTSRCLGGVETELMREVLTAVAKLQGLYLTRWHNSSCYL